MRAILLRFDAPLMSFGGPLVDNYGRIQDFPGLSLLAGLLGNALGYKHSDSEGLDRLQQRVRYAVCRERRGEKVRDFQTVDFSGGTEDLQVATAVGWTTHEKPEYRTSSPKKLSHKHIRYRDYWADARFLVSMLLDPPDETPNLDTLIRSLNEPKRPLFIGRKTCLPSRPLYEASVECDSLVDALRKSVEPRELAAREFAVWWEEGDAPDELGPAERLTVVDERDWKTQLHGGQRILRRGILRPQEEVSYDE